MRKNIFEIVSESIDMESEVDRIVYMSRKECTLCTYQYYTIFDFVDGYCFKEWAYRGHFTDIKDYLKALDYSNLIRDAKTDVDSFITLIELTYNFWYLSHSYFGDPELGLKWQGNYYHLRDVMLDNLEKYNYKAFEDGERILVIEDKPEVTAVAEIAEPKLAVDIIRYNHNSLKGEIELKKLILLSLGSELEPKRNELSQINKQLSEDIFFMLNNLNLRHNNRSKNDKKYKEYVAKMRKNRLEKWYDELYQMMLLGLLLLDNVGRTERVKELKLNVTGGNK